MSVAVAWFCSFGYFAQSNKEHERKIKQPAKQFCFVLKQDTGITLVPLLCACWAPWRICICAEFGCFSSWCVWPYASKTSRQKCMLHYLTHTLCENNMHIHVYFKKLTNSSLLVRSLYCSHKKKNGADSDLLGAFFLQLNTHTRINREKKKKKVSILEEQKQLLDF